MLVYFESTDGKVVFLEALDLEIKFDRVDVARNALYVQLVLLILEALDIGLRVLVLVSVCVRVRVCEGDCFRVSGVRVGKSDLKEFRCRSSLTRTHNIMLRAHTPS